MKIENYGDLISKYTGKKLLAYVQFGSYQGDYIVALDSGLDVELWRGSYGSCSGCDWLEAERDWETNEVPDDKVKDFMKNEVAFAQIPKETIKSVDAETFLSFLPANAIQYIDDFDPQELLKEILKELKD